MQPKGIIHGQPTRENAFRLQLSLPMQIAVGVGTVLVLAGSIILSDSLIPIAVILAAFVVFAVVRNPVATLFAFIVINVYLTVHSKASGAPSGEDIALGAVIAIMMAYWLVRIRIFQWQDLSHTKAQLALAIFSVWAILSTAIGSLNDHNSLNNALREVLNLSPLLFLPAIYSYFVESGSKSEKRLFMLVLAAALVMVTWNFFRVRSDVVRALYLYQVGRGSADEMLSVFLVFFATSLFMTRRKWSSSLLAIMLFLMGVVGVAISFARTLYVLTFMCLIGIILLGNRREILRGLKWLVVVAFTSIAAFIPLFYSYRVFRLLLLNYGMRFLSSQHLGTDLSLNSRYVEWRYEWQAILHSPILGHGFGTPFRMFDIIQHLNVWMTFSHSSFLYIIFKTGFLGAILLFGAYFSFLLKGFRLLKSEKITDWTRIILRTCIGYSRWTAYLGIDCTSV